MSLIIDDLYKYIKVRDTAYSWWRNSSFPVTLQCPYCQKRYTFTTVESMPLKTIYCNCGHAPPHAIISWDFTDEEKILIRFSTLETLFRNGKTSYKQALKDAIRDRWINILGENDEDFCQSEPPPAEPSLDEHIDMHLGLEERMRARVSRVSPRVRASIDPAWGANTEPSTVRWSIGEPGEPLPDQPPEPPPVIVNYGGATGCHYATTVTDDTNVVSRSMSQESQESVRRIARELGELARGYRASQCGEDNDSNNENNTE